MTYIFQPFREGINIGISNDEFDKDAIVMLDDSEAKQLRDVLLKLYPVHCAMGNLCKFDA